MTGRSWIRWTAVRNWCITHPDKQAAIVTPAGTFTITFAARKTEDFPMFASYETDCVPGGLGKVERDGDL